jgi:hypothetical protein
MTDTSTTELTWDDLCPQGRVVFYEGDDPDRFAAEMAALGIDVRADLPAPWRPEYAWYPDGYAFHLPAGRVEEIYGSDRWELGS